MQRYDGSVYTGGTSGVETYRSKGGRSDCGDSDSLLSLCVFPEFLENRVVGLRVWMNLDFVLPQRC